MINAQEQWFLYMMCMGLCWVPQSKESDCCAGAIITVHVVSEIRVDAHRKAGDCCAVSITTVCGMCKTMIVAT